MIRTGHMNTLEVFRQIRGGWELRDEKERIVLPTDHAPWDLEVGAEIEVFVYTDTHDQRVATTQKPLGLVGDIVSLEVVDLAGPGAFCEWGLDKDLLIPHSQMHTPLHIGDTVVVAITMDAQGRIMGESWLGEHFHTDTRDLAIGQPVKLLVYGYAERGILVVVEGRWAGMLFYDQTHQDLAIGESVGGFIDVIRDDGRLDISLEPPRDKRERITDEVTQLAAEIALRGGFLGLTDKSDPNDIRRELRMSKKAFKRAVGGLYKAHKIAIEADGLRWVDDDAP
jgi:hypothetical protein